MNFSINTRNFPPVYSYNMAKGVHDCTKPKRTTGQRHIAGKMHSVVQERKGNIEFVYHGTAVVTYTPNNHVLLDLSYVSVSTRMFANALTPPAISITTQNWYCIVRVGGKEFIEPVIELDLNTLQVVSKVRRIEIRKVNVKRAAPVQKLIREIHSLLEVMFGIAGKNLMLGPASSTLRRMGENETIDDYVRTQVLPYVRRVSPMKLGEAMYEAYDVYDWIELPYGVVPKKGQIGRFVG